jgi:ABC-type enterochelin transport system ATPase subunit
LTDEQLDSVWTWFPKDKVEIQFRVSSQEEWQDIANGSAGQQTGALLSFILNEGDEPLILDQPEDDLDNAMVYELVVQQLRKNKERRQVIVVTHNANIVVNGDAELVISMAFKGGQIQMDTANGLQDMSIRRTICKVMEGGRIAFDKRYKRILKGMT